MKVIIEGKTYDPNKTPIILVLDEQDKVNISNMPKEAKKFACYPKGLDKKEIEKLMM